MATSLGLDITSTSLLVVGRDEQAGKTFKARYRMDRCAAPRACTLLLLRAISNVRKELDDVEAIGIGFPGGVDVSRGVVKSSHVFRGWENFRIADTISSISGLPCRIDSRTNNIARAEAARRLNRTSMLYVHAEQRIEGAVLLGGQVWPGKRGLAGEIGHVTIDDNGHACECGRSGCVETYASQPAIERTLGIRADQLTQFAQAPPEKANDALCQAGTVLGTALASALNLLDAELVVLDGALAAFSAFRESVEYSARSNAIDEIQAGCVFETARVGKAAGGFGAMLLGSELITASRSKPVEAESQSAA